MSSVYHKITLLQYFQRLLTLVARAIPVFVFIPVVVVSTCIVDIRFRAAELGNRGYAITNENLHADLTTNYMFRAIIEAEGEVV